MFTMFCLLFFFSIQFELASTNCYENWSRCTPQTSGLTGILWQSCRDRCRNCIGRESGECVRVFNKECSGGYQCQCSGGTVPKTSNPVTNILCSLGL